MALIDTNFEIEKLGGLNKRERTLCDKICNFITLGCCCRPENNPNMVS